MCKKWRRTANTDANHQRTRVSTRGPAHQRPEQMQLRDADTRKQVVPGEGRTQGRRTHGRGRRTQGPLCCTELRAVAVGPSPALRGEDFGKPLGQVSWGAGVFRGQEPRGPRATYSNSPLTF